MISPAFSPDSKSIVFYQEGMLRRMSVSGGAAIPLAPIDVPFGLSWSDGDVVLAGQGAKGIVRVSASYSGMPERLVTVGEGEFAHGPQMLPGGDAILFTLAKGLGAEAWDEAEVVVQSLTSSTRTVVAKGADARYLPSRHLVYAVGGMIYARAFDVRTRIASPQDRGRAVRRTEDGFRDHGRGAFQRVRHRHAGLRARPRVWDIRDSQPRGEQSTRCIHTASDSGGTI